MRSGAAVFHTKSVSKFFSIFDTVPKCNVGFVKAFTGRETDLGQRGELAFVPEIAVISSCKWFTLEQVRVL